MNVSFEPSDWNTGRANDVIALLKTFPKGSKFYLPADKLWRVNKSKVEYKLLDELYALHTKRYDEPKYENDYDADKWLDDTFGEEKVIV